MNYTFFCSPAHRSWPLSELLLSNSRRTKSSLEVTQILFLEEDNCTALDGLWSRMTFHVVFALNVKQGISQEEKDSHQRILLLGYKFFWSDSD